VELKGWVRTSLIDYPDHIASVLFTGGCNFRCPMCHNADLVLRPTEVPTLPEKEVWDFLSRREGLVDGVVITGGEPTLQPDLAPFIRRLKDTDLDVKLDTNGYLPDVLKTLLSEGLLDYVALDIKAPPEK
jgi:pyruvate formate lyase activating enzyme